MIKTHRRLATVLVGGLAVFTLAACGSNATSTGGDQGAAPSGNPSARAGGGQSARVPGVSGLIVSLSGKTMQVRTNSGQSAVTYTSKTTVTEQKSAKASDVKVGVCATVRSAAGSSSGSSSTPTTVTASTVSLSDEVDGNCQGGFGGGNRPSRRTSGSQNGGNAQSQPPGTPPSSGALPSGAPRGGFGGFGGASGQVTAVNGSTVTIDQTRGTEKTSVMVNLTADTTYTKQAKTGTDAIATNMCVFATGASDSTGALTATAIRLSAPVGGACGFGGQGRRNASGTQSGG